MIRFLISLLIPLILSKPFSSQSIQLFKHNTHSYLSFASTFQHSLSQSPNYLPPLLISSLLTDFNLTYLQIQMAHLTPPHSNLPPHGIQTIINSQANNLQQLSHLLNGVFGISKNTFKTYQQYTLNNKSYVQASDTDDVFCGENFEKITRMMPCGKHSGVLASLPGSLFVKYTSIVFLFERKGEVVEYQVKIVTELEKSGENLLIRGVKCGVYDESVVKGEGEVMKYQEYSKVFELKAKVLEKDQIKDSIKLTRWISGNWYAHLGLLSHHLQLTSNTIQKMTIFCSLPLYNLPNIKQITLSSNLNSQLQINNTVSSSILSSNNILQITIYPTIELKDLIVKIPYDKKVRNFELLKTTNRGSSEEFLKSIVVYKVKEEDRERSIIGWENLVDKTIEPDNAMPFNVFTFTMALIGYVWINVWKSYVKVVEDKSLGKQEDKLKKNN